MKVLVVGGAGYVGCVLVDALMTRGYDVTVLDRLYFGNNLPEGVRLIVGDMRNPPPVTFLGGLDAVINVGGLSNDPTAEMWPEANEQMNTVATRQLAEACKERGIERFIFASTCSIYDKGLRESDDVVQTEVSHVYPTYPYSISKLNAEGELIRLADKDFCPVILRKGTIYGYSPRMRYDLVVNTMVAHALSKSVITVFNGGEMWRPLIDVQDVARAYIACLEADADKVRGQTFNVSYGNFRISELAFRVQSALVELGIKTTIWPDYVSRPIRSYRVSTEKIRNALDFEPVITVEESVRDMLHPICGIERTGFDNPIYYNIKWMKLLEEAKDIISMTGGVF